MNCAKHEHSSTETEGAFEQSHVSRLYNTVTAKLHLQSGYHIWKTWNIHK